MLVAMKRKMTMDPTLKFLSEAADLSSSFADSNDDFHF